VTSHSEQCEQEQMTILDSDCCTPIYEVSSNNTHQYHEREKTRKKLYVSNATNRNKCGPGTVEEWRRKQ